MKKVFISGIAGFLGSHLADRLLKEDHEVVGCDNLIGGNIENIPEKASYHDVSCEDLESLTPLIEGCDIVYHCAALAHEGLSVFSPKTIAENIYSSTASIVSASLKQGVKRFVFCSSMARYGTNDIPFKEDMSAAPQDPYGISKYASELLIKNLSEIHGMEYTIAVPHNIIGPRQKHDDPYRNVASIMANRLLLGKSAIIYGDGEQKRSFSHVFDVIEPLKKMGFEKIANKETINLGPDEEFITINNLHDMISDIMGLKRDPTYMPARPAEVKYAYCSSEKARELLDYKTNYTIRQGIEDTINWIKKKGPKEFNYHVDIEIPSDICPDAWKKRLL